MRWFLILVPAYVVSALVVVGFLRWFRRNDRPMPEGCTDEMIRRVAAEGNRIEALRWYRTLHGVGLKEAIARVDAMKKQ